MSSLESLYAKVNSIFGIMSDEGKQGDATNILKNIEQIIPDAELLSTLLVE
jgi:hypothetical protein